MVLRAHILGAGTLARWLFKNAIFTWWVREVVEMSVAESSLRKLPWKKKLFCRDPLPWKDNAIITPSTILFHQKRLIFS